MDREKDSLFVVVWEELEVVFVWGEKFRGVW